ncbi:MAG: DUF3592 domain-containing protein [Pirellulales bacterium]
MVSRQFRPYGKKRGKRRTGSRRLGSLGEALFYLFFFSVGAWGLTLMLTRFVIPEWRANRHFVEHTCTVVKKQVANRTSNDATQFRPELLVQYEIDGQEIESWAFDIHHTSSKSREAAKAALDNFEVGESYPCWYDPNAPTTVILIRGYRWWMWLLLILPASFIMIGAAGVVRAVLQSSTSTERRAAIARKAAELDLFDEASERSSAFPHVPGTDTITDSPGTRLAYRLPVELATGWVFFGTLLLCLFWNGVIVWAAANVIRDYLSGAGDARAAIVVFILGIAGIGLGYLTVQRLMVTTGTGSARIEVSTHPFCPGGSYEIFLSQTGRTRVDWLEALLVCNEQVVYRQGTDTRIAQQGVHCNALYRREAFEIGPSAPFEAIFRLSIPADAMHSFKSDHNEVKWRILVRASFPRWPDYERSFPVVVYPMPDGNTEHEP